MINDQQAQELRQTLFSSGWTNVMRPSLEHRGMQALNALAMSRTERATVFRATDFDTDDDILRAIIRDCKWLVVMFEKELSAWENNRRADELDRQSTDPSAGANPR